MLQGYPPALERRIAWILAIAGALLEVLCQVGFLFAAIGVVISVIALIRNQRAGGALALSLAVVIFHLILNH
jgi:hypothetical protein